MRFIPSKVGDLDTMGQFIANFQKITGMIGSGEVVVSAVIQGQVWVPMVGWWLARACGYLYITLVHTFRCLFTSGRSRQGCPSNIVHYSIARMVYI
jgi:hypothetical protein